MVTGPPPCRRRLPPGDGTPSPRHGRARLTPGEGAPFPRTAGGHAPTVTGPDADVDRPATARGLGAGPAGRGRPVRTRPAHRAGRVSRLAKGALFGGCSRKERRSKRRRSPPRNEGDGYRGGPSESGAGGWVGATRQSAASAWLRSKPCVLPFPSLSFPPSLPAPLTPLSPPLSPSRPSLPHLAFPLAPFLPPSLTLTLPLAPTKPL